MGVDVDTGMFLSVSAFGFIFGSVVPIWMVFYLTPITKTIYDKIQFSYINLIMIRTPIYIFYCMLNLSNNIEPETATFKLSIFPF